MDNSVFAKMKKDKYLTKKDRSTPLDQAILFATFDLHRNVENLPFVQTMIMRTITQPAYAAYISQLYFIYQAMEEAAENCQDDPIYKPMFFPTELNRERALSEDLEYFYGKEWKSKITVTPAVERYVNRIRYIGDSKPAMLLPHNFVRYFGDLSGGQVLKYKMRKCLRLPDEQGVKFYNFDNITDSNKFMQFYVSRMNALELSNAMYDEMLEESRNAFQLNMDLFEDLEKLYPAIKYPKLHHLKNLFTNIPFSEVSVKVSFVVLGAILLSKVLQEAAV